MEKTCSACGQEFRPAFVFQIAVTADGERSHFCSLECRKAHLGAEGFRAKRARRVAILNQKGGTGKTTTAVNLAAGLAERENDCLLIDTDAQGNVGVSLVRSRSTTCSSTASIRPTPACPCASTSMSSRPTPRSRPPRSGSRASIPSSAPR
jgi:Mrp family chromosome partitioning ATPase